MQVMLNIPDEIPQEMVNKLLTQFEKQIQTAKKLVKKSVLKSSSSDDEIVALVKEVQSELYEREKQEDAQRWANYQLTGEAIGQVEMFAWMTNLSKAH